MAEALKDQFGAAVPRRLAREVAAVWPAFPAEAFLRDALRGYAALELMPRGRHLAAVLRRHLPDDFEEALAILMDSLGPPPDRSADVGMASFFYLPHTQFVADYGLDHFEASMRAQHRLTQRFTAEFSIRPFLERHEAATLRRLREWTTDPDVHVRRLVSEGTRPRLPWAPRLRAFQRDPRPVLALLERLKDDPELYVRRSVANNLNDIGKDHPAVLLATAKRWWRGAGANRRWIVRHALRSAIKRGDAEALALLGFGVATGVKVAAARTEPVRPRIGDRLRLAFAVANEAAVAQRLLVDLRVWYVKANGRSAPKVFKLKAVDLEPGGGARLEKTLSFAEMTTRRHYPGPHRLEALVNGVAYPLGTVLLAAAAGGPSR